METRNGPTGARVPWNKGKLTEHKPPLKLPEIWAIRTRLQMSSNIREQAMFNLAIDSKLRASDLTRLLVREVCQGSHAGSRAMVMQQKTQRPVQFEITEQTRQSIEAWIKARKLKPADYLRVRAVRGVVQSDRGDPSVNPYERTVASRCGATRGVGSEMRRQSGRARGH